MATEADLIQKFKDLAIPVGADFEELIHEAFVGANLASQVSKNKTNTLAAFTLAQSAQNQSNTNKSSITDLGSRVSVNETNIRNLKTSKVNTSDLPNKSVATLADTAKPANFNDGLSKNGINVPNDNEVASTVNSAIESATTNVAYENKDVNFLEDLQYKGNEVATINLLQSFYQADDDNTARQKAESLTSPGFVWFSENEQIPAGTILSTSGTGSSSDTLSEIGLTDNLLADFSNVPTGIQLNFSSDVWLNTTSAKIGSLSDFKLPTNMKITKSNIYTSSSTNAIYLPTPGVTSISYKSTNYNIDKTQANCNIYNNGGILSFNRILAGFGSGDTTHYYLLGIDSITAY